MRNLDNLEIWREARAITRATHAMTEKTSGELRQQMRRAAISIASNICEGAGRGSDADFHRFLAMARGSCAELRAQLQIAGDCGGIDAVRAEALATAVAVLGRRVTALMRRLVPP